MPVKNYLKKEEKEKLQSELKYNDHPDIRERILILLLQNDGKTQQEIADFVGCSARNSRLCRMLIKKAAIPNSECSPRYKSLEVLTVKGFCINMWNQRNALFSD